MLGHKGRVFKPHRAISAEALVPSDNFYCELEAKLDLTFVRELVGTVGFERAVELSIKALS